MGLFNTVTRSTADNSYPQRRSEMRAPEKIFVHTRKKDGKRDILISEAL